MSERGQGGEREGGGRRREEGGGRWREEEGGEEGGVRREKRREERSEEGGEEERRYVAGSAKTFQIVDLIIIHAGGRFDIMFLCSYELKPIFSHLGKYETPSLFSS